MEVSVSALLGVSVSAPLPLLGSVCVGASWFTELGTVILMFGAVVGAGLVSVGAGWLGGVGTVISILVGVAGLSSAEGWGIGIALSIIVVSRSVERIGVGAGEGSIALGAVVGVTAGSTASLR